MSRHALGGIRRVHRPQADAAAGKGLGDRGGWSLRLTTSYWRGELADSVGGLVLALAFLRVGDASLSPVCNLWQTPGASYSAGRPATVEMPSRHRIMTKLQTDPSSQAPVAAAAEQGNGARYRALFENIDAGFCVSEVKFDDAGRPVDHRVIEANPAFQRHTGLSDAVGRWASEVAPGIEQHWHDAYGHVAKTGEPVRFEGEARPLGRWYDAHLFPVGGGLVAMLIADTTARHQAEAALALSEGKWRAVFETLREGFVVGEVIRDEAGRVIDWRYEEVNHAWYDLVGIERGCAVGKTVREVFPGIEDDWVMGIAGVVDSGEAMRFTQKVGSLGRWYDGVAQHAGGDHFTVIFTEVTDRVLRERRQTALITLTDHLLGETTVDSMMAAASATLGSALDADLVGYGDVDPVSETITVRRDWTARGAPSIAGTLRFRDFGSYIEDLKRGRTVVIDDCRTDERTRGHVDALEARHARAFINLPVFERQGFVALFFVTTADARDWTDEEVEFVRDVAYRVRVAIERLRAEEQQQVLNGELAHRVKNTLSVVQAIANSTLARSAGQAAAAEFGNRLRALSSAHDVLLARSWSAASIKQIADSALASFADSRIEVSGPDIKVGSRTAMSLSLLLHELATNAGKYGALSVAEGRVQLIWSILPQAGDDLLEMSWMERGGPPAVEPTRRGFGSRIIRMGLTGSGGVKLHYDTHGLTAVMSAPLSQVQQG